jgi:hypothetical protein
MDMEEKQMEVKIKKKLNFEGLDIWDAAGCIL